MKILDLTLPTPAENLACDEALLEAAETGTSGEVLRFWESPDYFVVVGYANKFGLEVNVPACAARGIPILRRCSGGGTVVQGPGCLNYALVLRITRDGPTRSIAAANRFIMERNRAAIASSLPLLAASIQIQGHTDLTIDGRKFSGNAQRRRKHFLLFHGSLLLGFDLGLIGELLPMPSQQPDYRDRRRHADFLTNLELPAALVKHELAKAWKTSESTHEFPTESVRELVVAKYSNEEWNEKF